MLVWIYKGLLVREKWSEEGIGSSEEEEELAYLSTTEKEKLFSTLCPRKRVGEVYIYVSELQNVEWMFTKSRSAIPFNEIKYRYREPFLDPKQSNLNRIFNISSQYYPEMGEKKERYCIDGTPG